MVSFSLHFLPSTLIAFLLLSPTVLSAVPPITTTPNDPFRALSIHKKPASGHPVCCLTPLPSAELIDDDVLLTFEEWKAKQLAVQAQAKERESSSRSAASQDTTGNNNNNHNNNSDPVSADAPTPSASTTTSAELEDTSAGELLSPHFRVPLTDRFNYASLDCSARVHTAHASAKSPSAILSSKKDRYMLSPCRSEKSNGKQQNANGPGPKANGGAGQFVVVELCEDIRIDTVQLANFEFFSGVFKDFTVSVAKTYTTDAEGWTVAGTYRAKNVRGVQSFHPPTSLRDFYRYIRIDFHTHYSHEYYCPVSLLRVYGLTHLEQWKWDIWEAESRAKRDVVERARRRDEEESVAAAEVVEVIEVPEQALMVGDADGRTRGQGFFPANATREEVENFMDSLEDPTSPNLTPPHSNKSLEEESIFTSASGDAIPTHPSSSESSSVTTDTKSEASAVIPREGLDSVAGDVQSFKDLADKTGEGRVVGHDTRPSDVTPPASSVNDASSPSDASVDSSHRSEYTTTTDTSSTSNYASPSSPSPSPSRVHSPPQSLPVVNSTPTPSIPFIHPPPPPASGGGESIYRTIMNRLTALEANHTLYARYMEEQAAGVREMLRRLGEDVGRLEGIGKAQAQMYQRTVKEWERQRHRIEMEHWELMARVDHLADEVVLEKRLGIAQLCLLLAVLVFMGLTRGSRGEALPDHTGNKSNMSMREWSRRHLSFSNTDWTSRFKSRSRSLTPQAPARSSTAVNKDDKVQFPSSLQPPFTSRPPLPTSDGFKQTSERRPATAVGTSMMGKRSRTPTSLRTPTRHHLNGHHHHRPMTPTSGSQQPNSAGRLPRLLRTNSQGDGSPYGFAEIGPVPRSAKKWARSAHLHEVRAMGSPRGYKDRERERENDIGNVFRGSLMSTSPRKPTTTTTTTIGNDDVPKLVDKKGKGVQPLSAHRTPLSPLPASDRFVVDTTSDGGENDLWVDTDADGSELDLNSEPD